MKTQNLLNEYYDFVDSTENALSEIEKQNREDKTNLTELNKQYEEFISLGKDDKADALYNDIETLEKRVKMTDKKIETKRKVTDKVIREKSVEIIKRQKDVPTYYEKDASIIRDQLNKAVELFNDAIDKADKLQENVTQEMKQYVNIFREQDFENNNEVKKELRPHFTDNVLILENKSPIKKGNYSFDNKNKITLKGDQ
ncbi:hypothetical protein [Macrococcus armenti]|uniref:hypothetical protein n=1 Tax=Macrococcus armenti TaxID=2875764 RepID=UPI001CCE6421|nr:hypothetical protein [Macrococcus armenti]UBH15010.1 hypothetical protein LAU44_09750 [Macrococcus armenti]UBH17369.1 hypothetical protein LAU39_09775 [Macrococcus armenti]UBH19634.1 hypothetical protein LAU40_09755 [Macrococcus armenti]